MADYQRKSIECINRDLPRACSVAVMFSNETYSQEIVPRLAHRLGGSVVGDGVELRVAGDKLSVVRQVYGAKAQAVIVLKRTPAVAWLRGRSFPPAEPRPASGEITKAALAVQADTRTEVVERKREEAARFASRTPA